MCTALCAHSTKAVMLWKRAWRPRAKASSVPRPKPSLRKDETYTLADRYRRSISAWERDVCKSTMMSFSKMNCAWPVQPRCRFSPVLISMIPLTTLHYHNDKWHSFTRALCAIGEPVAPERKGQQALRNCSWHLAVRVPRSGLRRRNGL